MGPLTLYCASVEAACCIALLPTVTFTMSSYPLPLVRPS
jgi:hypothetical protein